MTALRVSERLERVASLMAAPQASVIVTVDTDGKMAEVPDQDGAEGRMRYGTEGREFEP